MFSLFVPENVFKVHGDETVVVFKSRKYYVWFLVEHDTNLIVAWHVSRYRDMSQVRILLNKFFSRYSNGSVEFISDGLGAYDTAVNLFFKNINHVVVGLGGNNQCESKFSLFKDFVRLKRCFKKFDNFIRYVHGFCVVRNLFKLYADFDSVISALYSVITTS
jgi:transposase-like protein